MHWTDFMYI